MTQIKEKTRENVYFCSEFAIVSLWFDKFSIAMRFDYRIFFVSVEEFRNLIFTFFIFN